MYASEDDWDDVLLMDSNLCLKYANSRSGGYISFGESRADGNLSNILTEFPEKFREYYRINIKTFDYIMDSVKDDLQGCSKCIETEEKLTVALRYVLLVVVRIKINYIAEF